MPFSPGARRLSQLQIDVPKSWGGHRIDNVGAPDSDDDVPRARAGDILSGRFGMARMPDGDSGLALLAQGAGASPTYGRPRLLGYKAELEGDATAGSLQGGEVQFKPGAGETLPPIVLDRYDDRLRIFRNDSDPADKSIQIFQAGSGGKLGLRAGDVIVGRFSMSRMPDGPAGQFLQAQGTGADPVWAGGGIWEHIATVTLAADAATLDITGIPSGYTFLRLTLAIRHATLDGRALYLRFNDDAGSNYGYRFCRLEGSYYTGALVTASSIALLEPTTLSLQTAIYSNQQVLIQEVATNRQKTVSMVGSMGVPGVYTPAVHLSGGAWNNTTSKVTKITLFSDTGNLGAGSKAILEGTTQ